MNRVAIIPPHSQQRYFVTTVRNSILFWFANLVIVPTYLALVVLSIGFTFRLGDYLHTLLASVILLVTLIPIWAQYSLDLWWQVGFAKRELMVICSILISSGFFYFATFTTNAQLQFTGTTQLLTLSLNTYSPDYVRPLQLLGMIYIQAFLPIAVTWAIISISPILNHFRWRLIIISLAVLLLLISTIFLLARYSSISSFQEITNQLIHDTFSLASFGTSLGSLLTAGYIIVALVALIYSARRIYLIYGDNSILKKDKETIIKGKIPFMMTIALTAVSFSMGLWTWVPMLCLGIVITSTNQPLFYSRILAGIRTRTKRSRHDLLNTWALSPSETQHWINRLSSSLFEIFRWDNHTAHLIIILTLGFIVFPLLYYPAFIALLTQAATSNTLPDIFEYLGTGALGCLIVGTGYVFIQILVARSRYAISQFEVISTDEKSKDPEAQAIANLLTHKLVEELQSASAIFQRRQVEGAAFSSDGNNAFFVTSGVSREFLSQADQIVSIDLSPKGTINLGRLFAFAFRWLTRLRIEGKVQRRSNQSVEIWVQIVYRGSNAAAVEQVILPENDVAEIDDITIRPVARQLAIKLLLELGFASHLGKHPDSLNAMLRGLEASSKHDWWQSISHYRQALVAEETLGGSYGIGHYQLGVALLYQGDLVESLQHLRVAEQSGPPLAETHYMLALALLTAYWGDLDSKPTIFAEITHRLETAIRLRANFPEAYQLLGTAYFRRGRLQIRNYTRGYDKRIEGKSTYLRYFRKSVRYMRTALRLYDNQRGIQVTEGTKEDNIQSNFITPRLTMAHQLADSLRYLEHYSEAASYYGDVLAVYPRNIRNIADLSKTYCLARNWQRAESFLQQFAFNDDVAFWDADVCIHMGWALAGGLVDTTSNKLKRSFDWRLRSQYNHTSRNPDKTTIHKSQAYIDILAQAVQFLDYSIHQRPRYVAFYSQTDWFEPLRQAFDNFQKLDPTATKLSDVTIQAYADGPLLPDTTDADTNARIRAKQLRVWIALRMYSFGIFNAELNNSDRSAKLYKAGYEQDATAFLSHYKNTKDKDFIDIYETFLKEREVVLDFTLKTERINRAGGFILGFKRLKIALRLFVQWREALSKYRASDSINPDQALGSPGTKPTFFDRWLIDVYCEFALLTARMLADARAYELLYEVVDDAAQIATSWVRWWRQEYGDKFTFMPRTARYHTCSLLSWRAFALYQCHFDRVTAVRLESYQENSESIRVNEKLKDIDQKDIDQKDIDQRELLNLCEADLANAREHIQNHPLTLFVQALVTYKRGLYSSAIENFKRLLDLIAPVDPKKQVTTEPYGDYASIDKAEPLKLRTRLRLIELISGRQQFYSLVNSSTIHYLMGEVFREMDKPNLRVQHLIEAVRQSKFDDVNLDNFLRIANQLNDTDRYSDAMSVIEAMRYPLERLGRVQFFETKRILPDILRTVTLTRSYRHSKAFALAKSVASRYRIPHVTGLRSIPSELDINKLDILEPAEIGEFLAVLRSIYDVMKEPFSSPFASDLSQKSLLRSLDIEAKTLGENLSLKALLENFTSQHRQPAKQNQVENAQAPSTEVFRQVEMDHIETASVWAAVTLNRGTFREKLKQLWGIALVTKLTWEPDNDRFNLKDRRLLQVIGSQIVDYFSREASNSLSQLAELRNALAYNRAETGINLEHAHTDSATAIVLTTYLMHMTQDPARRTQFSKKLAQFYDTFGWIRYRYYMQDIANIGPAEPLSTILTAAGSPKMLANNKSQTSTSATTSSEEVNSTAAVESAKLDQNPLKIAEKFLRRAVRYDPERAIVHYHLARLHLTHAELAWQNDTRISDNALMSHYGAYIDMHLQQALREWRNAKTFDHYDRLHTKLAWLYNRVNTLKRHWERRQLRILANDDSARGIEMGLD